MACRPQDNPRSTSSDGVSPELAVLGLREASLCPTGLTGRRGTSSGCDRCDPARSSACVLANSASTYFLVTPLGKDLSSSGAMAGDKVDSKVDATPVDIQYEDIPEETRKNLRQHSRRNRRTPRIDCLHASGRLGKACSRRKSSRCLRSHRRRTHLLRLQLLLRLLPLQAR